MGNLVPANTKNNVYFGHLLQTPLSSEKVTNLGKFYANLFTDEEAKNFLINNQIKYIIWSKEERDITKNYGKTDQLKYNFLKPIFQSNLTQIFSY